MANYLLQPSLTPNDCQKDLIARQYGMFIHFGINTYNDVEWSDGKLPASSFNPNNNKLDVDSWVRTAYEAGMKYVIVLTKHHDGFCYWETDTTEYSVKYSPCKTDIIMEAKKACEKYGLKLGLYYSLWDRHEKCYKKHDQYVAFMEKQFRELLGGKYGEICEFWLDGGWDKRNNKWQMQRLYDTVKGLQPQCAFTVNVTIGKWNSKGGAVKKYYPEKYKEGMPMKYFPSDFRLLDPHFTKQDDPKIYMHKKEKYYLPFEATICVRNMKRWFWGKDYNSEKMLTPQFIADKYKHFTSQQNTLVVNLAPTTEGKFVPEDVDCILQTADILGIRNPCGLK